MGLLFTNDNGIFCKKFVFNYVYVITCKICDDSDLIQPVKQYITIGAKQVKVNKRKQGVVQILRICLPSISGPVK